jgi:hypothetical protein
MSNDAVSIDAVALCDMGVAAGRFDGADRVDVAPPGREEQVKKLKTVPGVDNPYAVAWASYEGDDEYDGAKCDGCGQVVPVCDGTYDSHACPMQIDGDDKRPMRMCDGSGAECKQDSVSLRGGKWVVLPKSGGDVLGIYATREEAEAQERALSSRSDEHVRRYERIDFAPSELPKARVTADGFLHVTGRVARTGIQEYRDGQGGIRKELRLPDEVSKSLPSFPLQPMTNQHPSEMVDPTNAQKYAVGAVGEATLNADGWVEAPLSIWRADAIEAARNGRVQLSVGYSCRLDNKGGEWNGQRYDAIQRDIVVNHVALVDVARAGSDARLRLDAKDAIACDTTTREFLSKGDVKMAKLIINGMTFEVADANAQAAYDGERAAITKACDEKVAAEKLRADNAEKLLDATRKDKDALQGKYDAKLAEDRQPIRLDGQEIPVVDAVDQAKFDAWSRPIIEARAQARAALLVEARKHLGANERFDAHRSKDGKDVAAKSDTEIKRLVVLKLDPSAKLDGKSDEYIQARYDAAIERADKAPRGVDAARTVTAPTLTLVQDDNEPALDPAAARKAMEQRMLQANVRHPKHDANGKV